MGSEAQLTAFHLTGFKKFQGVPINPAETIITSFPEYLKSSGGLNPNSILGNCTTLDTAAQGGLQALYEVLEGPFQEPKAEKEVKGGRSFFDRLLQARFRDLKSDDESKPYEVKGTSKPEIPGLKSAALPEGTLPLSPINGTRVIWVHIGVNSGASRFAIERRAVNEATFRCPDELGWQPQKEPIAPEDGPITKARVTQLPATEIARALRVQGFDVGVSDDAGRFVCNYVYYQSLRHAELYTGASCLFVHVPLFSAIDKSTQLRFLAALLNVLASC